MWCLSAYEYVVVEANMTKIFAVYFMPLLSQVSRRNILSSAAVNSLGDGISLLYTSPDVDLVAFFVQMDCHRAVGVDVLQEFDVHIFYLLFLKRDQYYLSLHRVEGFLVVDECDAECDVIFSALLLQLVYDMDLVCR